MNRSFPQILSDLARDLEAAAVLLWRRGGGYVLACWPSHLLETGTPWPTERLAELARDPGYLGAMLPTALRLVLPGPATGACAVALDDQLALTVVWCSPDPSRLLPLLQERLREGLATRAGAWHAEQRLAAENERLSAVLCALDQAVITVNDLDATATLNQAAADLLELPRGHGPASAVARSLQALQARVLNPEEPRAVAARLLAEPDASILNSVWVLDAPRRHFRVSTHRLPQGRLWILDDISHQMALLDETERARAALEGSAARMRAMADGMLDPQVLIRAVREGSGAVVDFEYTDVNRATGEYLGVDRDHLLATRMRANFPGVVESGLFALYVGAVDSGADLVLDDFHYRNEILGADRRYDIRASRVGDGLSLTWRDVTERFESSRRLAESEAALRTRNQEFQEALERVKTLEGILPICMYCKKIRDGQDEWNKLEEYLSAHSDALFSHGMCPDCFDRVMGDLDAG